MKLDQIRAVSLSDGLHIGLKPSLPTAIVELWTLVNPPNTGYELPARSTTAGVTRYVETPVPVDTLIRNAGGSDALLVVALALVFGVLVRAALAAGYLGSLQEYRKTGSYAFGANVRQYLGPFLLFELAWSVLLALGGIVLLAVPGLFVFGLLAYLVGAYLFYGAPFLFVVEDYDFAAGLRQSYRLALDGGDYWSWAVSYFGVTLAISTVSSLFVVSLGLVGVLLGLAVVPAIGMALTMATLSFFDDRSDLTTQTGAEDTSQAASLDSL